MNQEAVRDLEALFSELFAPDELRHWLRDLPDGRRMENNLPGGSVSSAQFVFATVDILRRYGLLSTTEFWTTLHATAPQFIKPKVLALAAKSGVSITAPANDPPTASRPDPLTPAPARITVLLLSASPSDASRLRVDLEFRKIIDKIRSTRFRDVFKFVQVQAARFEDLQTALIEHQPHILHMSSHGEPDGSLRFETSDDASLVSKKRLLRLLKALRDNLRVVIINACYSEELVRDIPPTVDLAIGMNSAVPDTVSVSFAASFYEAIGYGRTVENAFDIALATLDDGDDGIPQLFPSTDKDPERRRKLILVQKS